MWCGVCCYGVSGVDEQHQACEGVSKLCHSCHGAGPECLLLGEQGSECHLLPGEQLHIVVSLEHEPRTYDM